MWVGGVVESKTHCDFKVHHLIRKCRHFVVEAKPVFTHVLRRKHKVPLSLFLTLHDFLVVGPYYTVVDIEGSAGLNLEAGRVSKKTM